MAESRKLAKTTIDRFERQLRNEEARLLHMIEVHEAERDEVRLAESSAERSPDPESADGGSMAFEFEKELSVDRSNRDLLVQIREALAAIEEGTYGDCLNCGNPIPVVRLRAIPHTSLCVNCSSQRP